MPSDLTVKLSLPADLSSELTKHCGLLAFVKDAYPVVDSADIANLAAAERKNCLAIVETIAQKMGQYIAPAQQIIEQAKGDFKPAIENAQAAAEHLKTILLDWDTAERKRLDEERRKKEEDDRKARAKADEEAAAARARAQTEAEEKRRKAQEAEDAKQAALAKGDTKGAAKQAGLAAKLQEEANHAEEKGDAEARRVQAEAEAQAQANFTLTAPKVVGFGSRKNWKAELAPEHTEHASIAAIITAMTGVEAKNFKRPELIAYLTLDMSALHKSAKALEANFNVPGLRARNIPVGVSR